MTPVSNYLNLFIKEEFNYKHLFNELSLSKQSINFIQQMIQFIDYAHDAWKTTSILEEKDISLYDSTPVGKSYDAIPIVIRNHINKSKKIGKIYKFKINSQFINLTIIFPFSENDHLRKVSKKKSNLFFKKCYKKIFLWLHLANRFKGTNCSNTINIYIYMTDFFKLLPNNNTTFNVINVNTAFTTSCQPNTEINIFREEEWFKVLIHETFHCFGLDFSNNLNMIKQLETQVVNLFNLSLVNINVFETYCEINACFINLIFCCFFYKLNTNNKINEVEVFKKMLIQEQIFSVFQCNKVLSYIGIKYNDFFNLNLVVKYKLHFLREGAYYNDYNVFVYYILKSIMLVHINNYIEWIFIYNNKSLLFNISNEINENMFYKLIETSVKSNNYNKIINNISEWTTQCKIHDSLIQNTLRMTIWELQ
jgi:hypothetical protein